VSGFSVGQVCVGFAVLLISLTVHELSHAWVADTLGDKTARLLGRVSLNPMVHADPIGTLLFPLIAAITGAPLIGWAKPVPVNPSRLHRPRRDYMLVAAAGPASNLVLAIGAAAAVHLVPLPLGSSSQSTLAFWIVLLLDRATEINVLLAVFNMIPIPPLDGGAVLIGVLPRTLATSVAMLRPYGFLLLCALLFTGRLDSIIGVPYRFILSCMP
jgi:Zn-dependent protease